MQASGVCKGHPSLPVSRFLYRHAHSCKLRSSLLHHTALSGLRFHKMKLHPPHGFLQVSASTGVDTQQNNAGTKLVKFVLQRRCEFGQHFRVIGDEKVFGAWSPEAAIPMQWSEGHIWTVELDLSVGTCVEFKVILMAEQELIEWQPGPDRKLDLSGAAASFVVFVTWSSEEDICKNEPQVNEQKHELQKTQDGDETASSVEISPDLVEDMEPETHANNFVDGTEEQTIEERSRNTGVIKSSAKDDLDELQTEAKGIVSRDEEVIYANTSLNFSRAIPPFAIPASWYGEEPEETSNLSSSHGSAKSSLVSLEDIAKGETTSFAFKSTSDDKEQERGEKLMSLNGPDKMISEGRTSSIILTAELEPMTRDEKDEVLLSTEVEASAKDEEHEERSVHDVPVEVTSQTNVVTVLPDTELKDIKEKDIAKHIVQNGPIEAIAEVRSDTMISTSVSNSQDQRDEKVLVDNDPSVVTAEVPETETPSKAVESLENVEMKPSTTAKERKWGRKGWSKLWSAFIPRRDVDQT